MVLDYISLFKGMNNFEIEECIGSDYIVKNCFLFLSALRDGSNKKVSILGHNVVQNTLTFDI